MKHLLPLCALLALCACSKSDDAEEASLSGNWQWDPTQSISSSETYVPYEVAFFDDGTAVISSRQLDEDSTEPYKFYRYSTSGNAFTIADYDTGTTYLSGAFDINGNSLSLNSFKYIKTPVADTSSYRSDIEGSWTFTDADGVTTLLQFGANSEGQLIQQEDMHIDPFRYAVKRNFLIQEFDDRYEVNTISFGNRANSVTIGTTRYVRTY